jgi:hypothetical protein
MKIKSILQGKRLGVRGLTMKRQIALTSMLVFLSVGITAPLVSAQIDVSPLSDIYLPFSGTVFNRQTGEDVAITGQVHVIARHTRNRNFTRVFLKEYDAIGSISNATYDLAQTSIDKISVDDLFAAFLKLGANDPLNNPETLEAANQLRIKLHFDAFGKLDGGSTILAGYISCTGAGCSNP